MTDNVHLCSLQALPDMGNKISKLEDEAASLDASGEVIYPHCFSFNFGVE